MITLRNKLYESLLDDEEDLVNNDIPVLLQDKINLLSFIMISKYMMNGTRY